MERRRAFSALAGAAFLVCFAVLPADLMGDDRDLEAGNDYLRVFIEDQQINSDNLKQLGVYALGTGPLHSYPEENILTGAYDVVPPDSSHGPKTTCLTIRSWTSQTDYVSRNQVDQIEPDPNYEIVHMSEYGQVFDFPNGFITVWELTSPPDLEGRQPNDDLTIVQETFVNGDEEADSRLRITTTVTNNGSATVEIGIRYLWDLFIGLEPEHDGVYIRTRDPDGPWSNLDYQKYPNPVFRSFEGANEVSPDVLHAFGTVKGPFDLNPPPTPPDLFTFAAWPPGFKFTWDFDDLGTDDDNGVIYYWGTNTDGNSPISIPPDGSASVTAYIGTEMFPDPVSENVPALTEWGSLALVVLICVILVFRRR